MSNSYYMMVEDKSGSKTSDKNIGSWPPGFDIQTFFLQSLLPAKSNIYIYIYMYIYIYIYTYIYIYI